MRKAGFPASVSRPCIATSSPCSRITGLLPSRYPGKAPATRSPARNTITTSSAHPAAGHLSSPAASWAGARSCPAASTPPGTRSFFMAAVTAARLLPPSSLRFDDGRTVRRVSKRHRHHFCPQGLRVGRISTSLTKLWGAWRTSISTMLATSSGWIFRRALSPSSSVPPPKPV